MESFRPVERLLQNIYLLDTSDSKGADSVARGSNKVPDSGFHDKSQWINQRGQDVPALLTIDQREAAILPDSVLNSSQMRHLIDWKIPPGRVYMQTFLYLRCSLFASLRKRT